LISSRDFASVQRAILALYSYRNIRGFRLAVPGIFLGVIRATYFSLGDGRVDPVNRSIKLLDLWESRPLRVGALRDAFERHLFDHPLTQHSMRTGGRRAVMLSDLLTLRQLRRMPVYRESLKPVNIGRVLAIASFSGPGVAALSVARPETEPNFTERDRRVMETLRPHFDQARGNLERESQLRASRSRSLTAHGMTPRETEVALWLAQGKTNAEIASILAAPVRTVEKHVERILKKMGVENRASAAVAVAEIIHG
jgi:DNA-binding CsgD family transcriptional regulator